jgi:hypothetical protein
VSLARPIRHGADTGGYILQSTPPATPDASLPRSEKIQVINSPRSTFIRELQSAYLQEAGGLVGESLNWDRSRGGDFRSLAQAVFSIEKYPSSSITLAPLERWLTQPDAVITDTFRERIHTTFCVLVELVRDDSLSKPFQKPKLHQLSS